MTYVWFAYAALVAGTLLWLLLSPARRRRAAAGGGEVWPMVLLFSTFGVAALLNGLLDTSLALLLVLPVSLLLITRQRRRLAGVPDDELRPYLRAWRRTNPSAGDLLRHPWRSARATASLARLALSRDGRAQEKEWERANGLR